MPRLLVGRTEALDERFRRECTAARRARLDTSSLIGLVAQGSHFTAPGGGDPTDTDRRTPMQPEPQRHWHRHRYGEDVLPGLKRAPGTKEWYIGKCTGADAFAIAAAAVLDAVGALAPLRALNSAAVAIAGIVAALAGFAGTEWAVAAMAETLRLVELLTCSLRASTGRGLCSPMRPRVTRERETHGHLPVAAGHSGGSIELLGATVWPEAVLFGLDASRTSAP